ncbi:hypothetical protein [Dokdonella sp.]|uniref:hypothetical protein n=1 Tax=Dokdonella sp. TaxID=2291710 RepID=UPI003783D855
MRDGDIDYSSYGLSELEEALAGINRQRYPKNFENLYTAYQRIREAKSPPKVHEPHEGSGEAEFASPGPKHDENRRYVPNEIQLGERVRHLVFSLLLLAYGAFGLWVNDLYVPGKRRGIHLHDVPAWVMYGAIICACMVMLSVVIDHHDRRNNEKHYRTFAKVAAFVGWTLFTFSVLWGAFSSTR